MKFKKGYEMILSARNHLKAVISEVKTGVVSSIVSGKLADGQMLKATITVDSEKALGLKEGKEAYFIFKAPSVIIAKEGGEGLRLSATNQLKAIVKDVVDGAVNTEVIVTCGDSEISAIITKESAQKLSLKVGEGIVAIIKATQVIIGVK